MTPPGRYRGIALRGVRFGWRTLDSGEGCLGVDRVRRGPATPCDGCDRLIHRGDPFIHVNAFNPIRLCLTCGDRCRMNPT